MDVQPEQTQQTISDDQELAKVLAGINEEANVAAATVGTATESVASSRDSDTPSDSAASGPSAADGTASSIPDFISTPLPIDNENDSASETIPVNTSSSVNSSDTTATSSELEDVKHDAIVELRPLIEKLDVPAEEKFDTYLLLIRSTDDKSLVGPAHEVAKQITDEARRAQALLDIIKEIDFLSHPQS